MQRPHNWQDAFTGKELSLARRLHWQGAFSLAADQLGPERSAPNGNVKDAWRQSGARAHFSDRKLQRLAKVCKTHANFCKNAAPKVLPKCYKNTKTHKTTTLTN